MPDANEPEDLRAPAAPEARPPVDRAAITLTNGEPVPDDRSHERLRANGQQEGYVVLTAEERAKGFVKPVRSSYVHVPPGKPTNLRDLTDEERARHARFDYVKFEPYGEDRAPVIGKYWTRAELDRVGRRCGATTTMGRAIAETYARDPSFYGGTFCVACGAHYPLAEFIWSDGEPMDPARQPAWAEEKRRKDIERLHQRRDALIVELDGVIRQLAEAAR